MVRGRGRGQSPLSPSLHPQAPLRSGDGNEVGRGLARVKRQAPRCGRCLSLRNLQDELGEGGT